MAKSNMFVQYDEIKKRYPDAVLFFRLGDFYELFYEDAITCSKILDLTLTAKSSGEEERAPMCGIPYHSVDTYINKLINHGFKIAVCEQLESDSGKYRLVNRDVVRLITPGTIIDEGVVDQNKNNYIACIYQKDNTASVAICEISTGEFSVAEFDGDSYIELLNDCLIRTMPSEIICYSDVNLEEILPCQKLSVLPEFTKYDEAKFTKAYAVNILSMYFGITYEEVFDLKRFKMAQIAGGALLAYLEQTQKRTLSHINKIVVQKNNDYMHLDYNTRRNLEILETLKERRKKGALLSVIDKTKTPMGARLIKNWLQEPLYKEKEINSRLDAVEELIKRLMVRDSLKECFSLISDIERISGRVAYGNFTPKDARKLGDSLAFIPKLKECLSKLEGKKFKEYLESMPAFEELTSLLKSAFVDNPPTLVSAGGYIRKGFNKALDEIRDLKENSASLVNKLEIAEREKTGLATLKIGYNRVIGYFIELNKMYAGQVPMRYTRKQTVANNDRYITEELRTIQEQIDNAEENAIKLEHEIFTDIRAKLLENCRELQRASRIIAELDCLISFADVAVKNNYVKPKVSAKIKHIIIEDGRHPVVEDITKNQMFIPNDTFLDNDENKVMIITGPNMAGKSTYMRQVAIITLLAHMGCFVPARRAEIALTDRIFTRVGASDDLAVGQSTFMVEMMEVANILQNATENSLVVLDEIGRGTSTFDGLSIAWAVVEEIASQMHCKTMFATHYHELTELEGFLKGVKNYKIAIKDVNGKLVFLRKIQRGGANRSYGIEVADLAGVPKSVIDRAKVISKQLEKNDLSNNVLKEVSLEPEETAVKDKSYTEIIGILKDLDINKVTPLGAFETLCDLIQKVK